MSFHQIINSILFHKYNIIKFTSLVTVFLFLILYFVFPINYNSTVSILPPEKNSQFGGLSAVLGGGDLSGFLTGNTGSANSQLFIEILKSRSAAEYVVDKHNLIKYFDKKTKMEAVKELQDRLSTELTKEGIIKLNVEVNTGVFPSFTGGIENTKQLAADLSNSYVEALDKINREKISSKAKNAREYIERQLNNTRFLLDSVETSLMTFQKTNKTISLPEQVNAAIEGAAKLKAEIIKTEIDLGLAQSNLREDNKSLIALQRKLEQLKEQYAKMEMGNEDYLVSFREVPALGREMASLLREVKIQNEVYLLLQQQFYKEKIQESRDIPTVDVLDEAIPPMKASGPRVVFISVLGGILTFMLVSLLYISAEKKTIN